MAFEPLKTDEKLDKPAKKVGDYEGHLMSGCMAVGLTAFFIYALSAWPWFVFPDHRVSGIKNICLYGGVPALIFAMVSTIRNGTSGLSGSMGGAMIAAIFIWLRMQEISVGITNNPDRLQAEYPVRWAWMIPLAWFAAIILVAVFSFLFRRDKGEPPWATGQQYSQD
jgi:hypothetical protein